MIVVREMEKKLAALAGVFPVVAVLGPRQSGKTTIVRGVFAEYGYVSVEDLDVRAFAKEDPRGFLETYAGGVGLIIDEIQHVPELFSYLQTYVDQRKRAGLFILTGSQNFLLQEKISQSLAGRVALLTLLPFSLGELQEAKVPERSLEEVLFQGGYPRVCVEGIAPVDWYPNYIRNYLERDVRQIKNVTDLDLFAKFLRLCAGRVGQLLNLTSLGNDCGISANTARGWISLLEQSYIVFLLKPYHKNFQKRLVKMPKLYFYDTGVLSSLLGITSPQELVLDRLRGGVFESFVLSELLKMRYHRGLEPNITFWRDKSGLEVDGIIEVRGIRIPVEIKSGQTISSDYFKGLVKWTELTGDDLGLGYLVYGGRHTQVRKECKVLSWNALDSIGWN